MNPEFTIVIPVFNDVALFQRALNSVLCQDFDDFDVVVADDSTTDDIEQFISAGLSSVENPRQIPIHYLHNKPSLGAVPNWNQGMHQACGRHIIVMHHDEAMENEHHLTAVHNQLEQGTDIVVSGIRVFVSNEESTAQPLSLTEKKRHFPPCVVRFFLRHPAFLFLANPIGPCACVAFRKELMEDFDTRLHWLVDVEWYYRMLRHRKVIYDDSTHIHSIHGHQGQITGRTDIPAAFRKDKKVLLQRYRHSAAHLMLVLQQLCIIFPKSIINRIKGNKI